MADRPDATTPAQMALWWIERGEWKTGPAWSRAHEICQSGEGDPALDRIHALCHLIEGDTANAAYWYRRCGVAQVSPDPQVEWRAIAEDLRQSGQPTE